MTKTETVLSALKAAVEGLGYTVRRNSGVPVRVPSGGMILMDDGDPGAPEETLGVKTKYYVHNATLAALYQALDEGTRASGVDAIVEAVASALDSSGNLSGAVNYMSYSYPEIFTEEVDGGAPIAVGALRVVLEYQSDASV